MQKMDMQKNGQGLIMKLLELTLLKYKIKDK